VIAVVVSLLAAAPQVTFDEAVKRALEQHPSMRISASDAARALAILEQSRAPSLPTLYLNGSYTRLSDNRVVTNVAPQNALSANATLTVPLTPKNWVQWNRADANADAARATAFDVRRQVALDAGRAYLTALGAKRVVEASVHARDTGQAHLDYSSQRSSGGVGTRLDVVRAEQELQTSLAQLESALGSLAKAQEDLGLATGTDGPLEAVEEPALGAPQQLDAALQDAEGKRLDVRAAKSRTQAAKVSDEGKWSDYTPLLSAVIAPVYQSPSTLTLPTTSWYGQLVLSLPLYDGGLRYGQQKERHELRTSADAELDALLQQAHDEVRSGFELVKHDDLALSASQKSASSAHEALELATMAYKAGATTNLEVIDAERRSRDADLAVALAEDAARRARLELLAASGRFP